MFGRGRRALSVFPSHVLRARALRIALNSARPSLCAAELRSRLPQGKLSSRPEISAAALGRRMMMELRDVATATVEEEEEEEEERPSHRGPGVTDPPGATEAKKAKKERLKRKKPKSKGRKQKPKCSSSSVNLLAELPFAGAEVWTELGFPTSVKSQRKKRKKNVEDDNADDDDAKKKRQSRPNYFVSIPITNPQITDGIKAVQDLVVQKDHRLSRALVSVGSLHITLLVTYLGSEEEVNTAARAVAQMKPVLRDLLGGRALVLPFARIGHFKNEVVFVQLTQGEHEQTLAEIAEAVRKAFEAKGIPSGDRKEFKPHLTFMKLSKAHRLRSQGVRKLDPKLYTDFAEHRFGDETVSRLDLCSMLKKKGPDGYFHCEASVPLGTKRNTGVIKEALTTQTRTLLRRLDEIRELLSEPATRARIRQELLGLSSPGAPR
ncbi:A-kinase anchor protein 7 isoform X2 [Scleropages formosus]|uniref:A-kinase anchor protein 7 isoform X2 n=1 Tax=Scleropages formosus TaxID=113540 RepID=UPI0010FAC443|nr:A-kinase anchoring protein 7 isoform X2 [Scleropages formosus]